MLLNNELNNTNELHEFKPYICHLIELNLPSNSFSIHNLRLGHMALMCYSGQLGPGADPNSPIGGHKFFIHWDEM